MYSYCLLTTVYYFCAVPGQKRFRLLKLGPVGVGVAAQRHELLIVAFGPLPVARERGRARRAVEPVEAVGRGAERGLELVECFGRLLQLEQQFPELLARGEERTGRDRVFLGGVVQLRRRAHQPERLLTPTLGVRQPSGGDLPRDLGLLHPVVAALRLRERLPDGRQL